MNCLAIVILVICYFMLYKYNKVGSDYLFIHLFLTGKIKQLSACLIITAQLHSLISKVHYERSAFCDSSTGMFLIGLSHKDEEPTAITHSNRGQQSLGHVRHDDTNEEDDRLQPGVSQDEGQDEEAHAQEDSHARDDVDEMFNLYVDGRSADFQLRRQRGDASHHGSVTRGYHNATGRP